MLRKDITTEGLAIINSPEQHEDLYMYPTITISYLESVIPNQQVRDYMLSFLKTKFTTSEHSPVSLCFINIDKNPIEAILNNIVGERLVAKPSSSALLGPYNDWIIDKYFADLDDHGRIGNVGLRFQVLDKLESISSTDCVPIISPGKASFNYKHNMTFIVSSIDNPLLAETYNKNLALINTIREPEEVDWIKDLGGMEVVKEGIELETLDFCYYLGTEIEPLNMEDYTRAPYNSRYKENMKVGRNKVANRIVGYVSKGELYELAKLARSYKVGGFTDGWEKDRMDGDKLANLYMAITDGEGYFRRISVVMKSAGFPAIREHKSTIHHYRLAGLKAAKERLESEEVIGEHKKNINSNLINQQPKE